MLKGTVTILLAATFAASSSCAAEAEAESEAETPTPEPIGAKIASPEAREVMSQRHDIPAPVRFWAETPLGQEGCIEVRWDPAVLDPAVQLLIVRCEEAGKPHDEESLPAAIWDAKQIKTGKGMLWSRENGKTYRVAVSTGPGASPVRALGSPVRVTVADRQAPRPGWLEAEWTSNGAHATVGWTPHILDDDVQRIHLCLLADDGGPGKELAAMDTAGIYRKARPFYSSAPWLTAELAVPAGTEKIGVWCEDRLGNRGQMKWVAIRPAVSAATRAPCDLWTEAPTDNLPVDAKKPAKAKTSFKLDLMRGQAKGFQVAVKPNADLQQARVRFGPLVHVDGKATIPANWLAYHFVNYVRIDNNSCKTPDEELVWKAPAVYPDELSDDLARDLPAGFVQPIYIRVTAPPDAKAGIYRGQGQLISNQGSRKFTIAIRVWPVTLPENPRLKVTFWYQLWTLASRFNVSDNSEDGWRALARSEELFRAYHKNAIVVRWKFLIRMAWRMDDGQLRCDFADFDRFIRTFQTDGADPMFNLYHMGARTAGWTSAIVAYKIPVRNVKTGKWEEVDAVDILPAIQQHIEDLGLLDKFTVYVADEPIPENVDSWLELSARVHKAAPKLRRMDAILVPDVKGRLEILVPELNYFEKHLDQYRQAQKAGAELWFYTCWVPQDKYPTRFIDVQAIKPRVLHWMNALYDTDGFLYHSLNSWFGSLYDSLFKSPGDQYTVWPSRRYIANSSLRYEAQREGLEDCELLFMVRDLFQREGMTRAEAQAKMESIGRKVVRGFQDYTRSYDELEAVRRELLKLVAEDGS